MKSPKKSAHENEMTPWSNAGGRRCIARRSYRSIRTKKIHRAGCAFVHLPREPSASAYGPRERLRPTRAPCSVQEGRYGVRGRRASRPGAVWLQFAENSVCAAPAAFRAVRSKGPTQKFTEPVALSSTFPVNLRLPPTALGSGFDLLALRARCKNESTASARVGLASVRADTRICRILRARNCPHFHDFCGCALGRTLWITDAAAWPEC